MPNELATAPAELPAAREPQEPTVSQEELQSLLEGAVPGAEDLNQKLKAVFELSDENSSVRLRGE